MNLENKYKFAFLKFLAILLPYYFSFVIVAHDQSENPKVKVLWRYVIFGFLIYVLLGTGIILFKN